MTKQKVMLWLFPLQTDIEKLEYDYISNKKFMFMSITAISIIILCEVLLK